MNLKKVREFHWITKAVIILTVFVLLLIPAALVAAMLGFSNSGLGLILLSLTSVLMNVFLVLLVIIVIYMGITRVKAWIEKYLDAMLAKMDILAARENEREETGVVLAAMNGKVETIEKKLNNIERILENVSE